MAAAKSQPKPLRAAATAAARQRKPGVRELAAQATRDAILRAATKVFAKSGFEGGRVEQISKAAKSYDRMIYYYFGSKQGLFIAVLEDTYRRFNEAEAEAEVDTRHADPLQALQAVMRFMWGYYRRHPEFITLLNNENLHRGRHIGKSLRAAEYSSPAIAVLQRVLDRGAASGVFRPDAPARDMYLLIAALGYFYQSNRYTLTAFLGENTQSAEALARWEAFSIAAVLRIAAA